MPKKGNAINFDNGLVKTKKGWPKPTFLIVYMVADSSALAHKKSDNLSIIAVRQSGKRDSSPRYARTILANFCSHSLTP